MSTPPPLGHPGPPPPLRRQTNDVSGLSGAGQARQAYANREYQNLEDLNEPNAGEGSPNPEAGGWNDEHPNGRGEQHPAHQHSPESIN